MLDDPIMIRRKDPADTLSGLLQLSTQTSFEVVIEGNDYVPGTINAVVIAGMGGSALAAEMVIALTRGWLHIPLVVTKGYDLPGFVNGNTLVIAISHSGNTEETLSCYDQARANNCQLAAITTGGALFEKAVVDGVKRITIPAGAQPRMSTVYHLRGLLKILQHFLIIDGDLYQKLEESGEWLSGQVKAWAPEVPTEQNIAKQLALKSAGKTPVIYAGELTWPLAYKWKISWNESAKNIAFCNQYPEFNHNEFIGWSSHPVEKPFVVIDLMSHLEHPRIRERMELSDRLLSGMRPHAVSVELQGETLLKQLLWGLALGDAASIYTAILNSVDPAPVKLVERLKKELS